MSEAKKQSYDHVDDALVARVRTLVNGRAYSTKETYAVSNAVFQRSDKVQTCGTCVLRRLRELRGWLATYDAAHDTKPVKLAKPVTPKGPQTGRTVNLVGGGTAVVEGEKATDVKGADGKRPRPGSYAVEGGGTIVVNVRSARFDAAAEEVTPQYATETLTTAKGSTLAFAPEVRKAFTVVDGVSTPITERGTYPLADGRFLVVNTHGAAQIIPAGVEAVTLNTGAIFLVTSEGVAMQDGAVAPEGHYEAEDGTAYTVDAGGVIQLDLE